MKNITVSRDGETIRAAFAVETWSDSAGHYAEARFPGSYLLFSDECGVECLTLYTDNPNGEKYMPDDMQWSYGADELPDELTELYSGMKSALQRAKDRYGWY